MDDIQFIANCISGNKEDWDKFVERYSRLIYRYIHSVLKSKGFDADSDTISDLYQGVFLALIDDNYKKLKGFKARNNCSFASWLRTVTINFTLDYLRRYREDVSLDAQPDTEEEFPLISRLKDNQSLTPEKLLDQEKLTSLVDCIEGLSTDEQYFLDLHMHQGIGLGDLAKMFDAAASRPSLDMKKHRILDKLRDCFRKKIPEYFC